MTLMTRHLRSLLSGIASNQRLRYFPYSSSSIPGLAPVSSRPRNQKANIFEDDSESGGSAAYRHALKFSRPHTIKLSHQRSHLCNSISLIGLVERLPSEYRNRGNRLHVYTILNVNASPASCRSVRVFVEMWDETAKQALEHLKLEDYIYVSGCLDAFKKRDSNGNDVLRYKVVAKELNYVKQQYKNQRLHEVEQSKSQSRSSPRSREDRLRLWQIFLSNPQEWHDCRRNKRNPRAPDFKHKSAGESLWISADDPPWIKRSLQLLDSGAETGHLSDLNFDPDVSSYVD